MDNEDWLVKQHWFGESTQCPGTANCFCESSFLAVWVWVQSMVPRTYSKWMVFVLRKPFVFLKSFWLILFALQCFLLGILAWMKHLGGLKVCHGMSVYKKDLLILLANMREDRGQECFTAVICPTRSLWAVGVGMKGTAAETDLCLKVPETLVLGFGLKHRWYHLKFKFQQYHFEFWEHADDILRHTNFPFQTAMWVSSKWTHVVAFFGAQNPEYIQSRWCR